MWGDVSDLLRRSGPNRGLGNGRTINDVIDEAVMSNGASFRNAIVVLTVVNMLAAAFAVATIFWDTWRASKKAGVLIKQQRRVPSSLVSVHAQDLFPLMVLVVIILQGLIFAIMEGTSLDSAWADGCTDTSQIVWLAIWIVPFTTVVFAFDAVIRHYRKSRFLPQGRWSLLISVGVVMVMLLLAWIPAKVNPSGDRCVASLAWWAGTYYSAGIAIIFILLGLLVLCAVALFIQVTRNKKLENSERVAASRMVCQLLLTAVALCFILPFFMQLRLWRPALRSSQVATIVLNLFGVATCMLHLFMRLNRWAVILEHQKGRPRPQRRLKIFGRGERVVGRHITSPVVLQVSGKQDDSFDDRTPFAEKGTWPIMSPPPPFTESRTPDLPEMRINRSPSKGGYSLFPTSRSPSPPSPASDLEKAEEAAILQPPNPVFRKFHHRDASQASSATITFAMRMSHASRSTTPVPENAPLGLPAGESGVMVPSAAFAPQKCALSGHPVGRPPSFLTQDLQPEQRNGGARGSGRWI